MNKKIYLHIGFGKTGTTSIQEALYDNRLFLAEQGVFYPDVGDKAHGHHGLARLGEQSLADDVIDDLRCILHEFEVGSYNRLVLSSENFCFLKEEYIRQLAELIPSENTVVIFYVRKQRELIQSTYLEWQKVGSDYLGTIDNFFNRHKRSFLFTTRLKNWKNFFPSSDFIVHLYHREIFEDVIGDFCSVIGASLNDKSILNHFNESIIPEFSALISTIDALGVNSATRKVLIQGLLELSKEFKKCSAKNIISDELESKIYKYYEKDNIVFSREHLNRHSSQLLTGVDKR